MKRGFTVLKAASVMLSAIILGMGCQKNMETVPAETAAKSAAISSVRGEGGSFILRSMSGKEVGYMQLSDEGGYTRVEVSMSGTMARNSYGLTLMMHTSEGAEYARLNAFDFVNDGLNSGNYISVTTPLRDIHGKNPAFWDFWDASRGYRVTVYGMDGKEMATSTIKY